MSCPPGCKTSILKESALAKAAAMIVTTMTIAVAISLLVRFIMPLSVDLSDKSHPQNIHKTTPRTAVIATTCRDAQKVRKVKERGMDTGDSAIFLHALAYGDQKTLEQVIGVRIPGGQPNLFMQLAAFLLLPLSDPDQIHD